MMTISENLADKSRELTETWNKLRMDIAAKPVLVGRYFGKIVFSNSRTINIFQITDSDQRIGLRIESNNSLYKGDQFEHLDIQGNLATKDGRKVILVFLKDQNLETVFAQFCAHLIHEASDWENANGALFLKTNIKNWLEFLKKTSSALSEDRELQLFSEILVLNELISAENAEAVKFWKAPEGEVKTFVTSASCIVVKSMKEKKSSVAINSLEELETPPATFLAVFRGIKSQEGMKLSTLIAKTSERLGIGSKENELFKRKLSLYGYLVDLPHDQEKSWKIKVESWFDCSTSNFPKICRTGTSEAIKTARYEIIPELLTHFEIATPIKIED